MGIDFTEKEFEAVNERITAAIKLDGIECDNYAMKQNQTTKGFWMQLVEGFEKYFTDDELKNMTDYKIEEND